MLDDLAFYEIYKSDLPRTQLTRYWEHDFAGQGKLRVRRPHRGRPAIKDDDREGDAKYESVPFGAKNTLYYLTGEKDYKPVVYQELRPPQLTEEELERKRRAESPPEYNPRAHGHNQHTPKDMLVKHGAPTFSRKPKSDEFKIPRYIPQLPRGFGQITAPPAIKRKIGDGVALPIEREEQQTGHSESIAIPLDDSFMTPENMRSTLPGIRPFEEQNAREQAEGSDSDEDFPLGQPQSSERGIPAATSATINSLTQDVPHLMPYIERRAHEQKLAAEIMSRVENKQGVETIANELAEANVRLMDQDKEIERLSAAVAATQKKMAESNGKLGSLEAEVARLQQANEILRHSDL
jgi:uncharacterized coiled-coil protein SlyX